MADNQENLKTGLEQLRSTIAACDAAGDAPGAVGALKRMLALISREASRAHPITPDAQTLTLLRGAKLEALEALERLLNKIQDFAQSPPEYDSQELGELDDHGRWTADGVFGGDSPETTEWDALCLSGEHDAGDLDEDELGAIANDRVISQLAAAASLVTEWLERVRRK